MVLRPIPWVFDWVLINEIPHPIQLRKYFLSQKPDGYKRPYVAAFRDFFKKQSHESHEILRPGTESPRDRKSNTTKNFLDFFVSKLLSLIF